MRRLVALLLCIFFPYSGLAKIGSRNLDEEQKLRQFCVKYIPVPSSSDVTSGTNGVAFVRTINGCTALAGTGEYDCFRDTSGATGLPIMSKLAVQLLDAGTSDTLTCERVLIYGVDQFGKKVVENITSLTETAQSTSNAYSALIGVSAFDCAGSTDATDYLRVSMTLHIGLPLKVRDYSDIEMACIWDWSDNGNIKCARSNDLTAYDLQSAVNIESQTIDIGIAIFGSSAGKVAASTCDDFCFALRPSFY